MGQVMSVGIDVDSGRSLEAFARALSTGFENSSRSFAQGSTTIAGSIRDASGAARYISAELSQAAQGIASSLSRTSHQISAHANAQFGLDVDTLNSLDRALNMVESFLQDSSVEGITEATRETARLLREAVSNISSKHTFTIGLSRSTRHTAIVLVFAFVCAQFSLLTALLAIGGGIGAAALANAPKPSQPGIPGPIPMVGDFAFIDIPQPIATMNAEGTPVNTVGAEVPMVDYNADLSLVAGRNSPTIRLGNSRGLLLNPEDPESFNRILIPLCPDHHFHLPLVIVGVIGNQNIGKSFLLRQLTKASVRVARTEGKTTDGINVIGPVPLDQNAFTSLDCEGYNSGSNRRRLVDRYSGSNPQEISECNSMLSSRLACLTVLASNIVVALIKTPENDAGELEIICKLIKTICKIGFTASEKKLVVVIKADANTLTTMKSNAIQYIRHFINTSDMNAQQKTTGNRLLDEAAFLFMPIIPAHQKEQPFSNVDYFNLVKDLKVLINDTKPSNIIHEGNRVPMTFERLPTSFRHCFNAVDITPDPQFDGGGGASRSYWTLASTTATQEAEKIFLNGFDLNSDTSVMSKATFDARIAEVETILRLTYDEILFGRFSGTDIAQQRNERYNALKAIFTAHYQNTLRACDVDLAPCGSPDLHKCPKNVRSTATHNHKCPKKFTRPCSVCDTLLTYECGSTPICTKCCKVKCSRHSKECSRDTGGHTHHKCKDCCPEVCTKHAIDAPTFPGDHGSGYPCVFLIGNGHQAHLCDFEVEMTCSIRNCTKTKKQKCHEWGGKGTWNCGCHLCPTHNTTCSCSNPNAAAHNCSECVESRRVTHITIDVHTHDPDKDCDTRLTFGVFVGNVKRATNSNNYGTTQWPNHHVQRGLNLDSREGGEIYSEDLYPANVGLEVHRRTVGNDDWKFHTVIFFWHSGTLLNSVTTSNYRFKGKKSDSGRLSTH